METNVTFTRTLTLTPEEEMLLLSAVVENREHYAVLARRYEAYGKDAKDAWKAQLAYDSLYGKIVKATKVGVIC